MVVQQQDTFYPYAIRDHNMTASTTMSDGISETERLSRDSKITDNEAGVFHDLLMITGVNSSNQAIRLDIHENFGGGAGFKLQIPADDITQIFFKIPWKMSEPGGAWFADYDVYGGVTDADDVTNTTVNIYLQYIKVPDTDAISASY